MNYESYNKDEYIDLLERLLSSFIGSGWRDMSIEEAIRYRMQKEGEQVMVLSRLAEIASKSFDGRSRFDLIVFGDGTVECMQAHEMGTDNGKRQTKIRIALPQKTYCISSAGMKEMVDDIERAEWMDAESTGESPCNDVTCCCSECK